MSKQFRRFPYNFHDGQLIDFSIGPRREISLHVRLDPVWNEQQDRTVIIRFGGIVNMESVRSFFERIERPQNENHAIDEVIGLIHSREKRDVIVLDLQESGSIEIHTRNVTVV
jgi:hypothetical protein